ncbi:MAG: dihydroorotase family protein [Calditrichaceae bacterium]|nr:dihydroorotase family protein [Calditrichaceae bacterium]
MLIKNAKWLNSDGEFVQSEILIRNGKIAELSPSISSINEEIFDAADYLIVPGAIDPHVHFREPGQLYKEGIVSGSKAALRGGVTTIIDMPNNKPPCSTGKRVQQKKKLFRKKSLINWGVMLHTTPHNNEELNDQIKSAKIYMAKSSALPSINSPEILKKLFIKYPIVSIHAEDDSEFDMSPERSPLHHENRPRKAITGALQKIESILKDIPENKRPRVVICHMNTADEVEWITRMKKVGFDVWGETCPHYLYFTQDDYIKKGTAFQVNPPIRTKDDQNRLREAVASGIIDFIGSDHAPHSKSEKESANPPSGIAAIEWLMPQLLHFIDEGLLSWKQFHKLICTRASECYSIKSRDGITPGNFADLVFIKNTDGTQNEQMQTKAGRNLYKNFNFKWQAAVTMVNGVIKYDNKKFFTQIKGMEI